MAIEGQNYTHARYGQVVATEIIPSWPMADTAPGMKVCPRGHEDMDAEVVDVVAAGHSTVLFNRVSADPETAAKTFIQTEHFFDLLTELVV